MKTLLEVVNYKILSEDAETPMRGISNILGNLKSISNEAVPIAAEKSEWSVLLNPERLSRIFEFNGPREVKDFVTHLIFEQEEMGHHAKIVIENTSVTIVHSKTKNIEKITSQADILIAAVGRSEMVKSGWIKPGACVIDVGINRIAAPEKGDRKYRLVGDVDFDEASKIAHFITPVPGGVGPMTIACLLRNTVVAAAMRKGVEISIK